MCPISGFLQSLIVIFTLLLICHAVLIKSLVKITFDPQNATVYMYDQISVNYTVTSLDNNVQCILFSDKPHVAFLEKEIIIKDPNQSGSFNITGNFLGQTVITCRDNVTKKSISDDKIELTCLRKPRLIDTIFTASTATLVSIIYINFGCVIQWAELKNLLRRPVGPTIGFLTHFVFMPILSYGIGYALFPDEPAMRLGMFFTGVSPAGGASNIWTAILDGNIELSIMMSTISTFAAFAMMPFWLFTLGKTIFKDAHLKVPYSQISTYVIALIVPLIIGYLINRFFKKTGRFLGRILKGFSSILILFIIIFAIVTNLYIFELFSWKIIVSGMALPWIGYLFGYILAKIFKQPNPDALAIAIETGLENTGISIFLLRFALEPLHADLTTVAPISVAIMTPIPLTILYVYRKIKSKAWCNYKSVNSSKITENLCPAEQSSYNTNDYRENQGKQDGAIGCIS